MPFSTCCGAHTTIPEINICPECRDECDWEYEELADEDIFNNHITEGGVSVKAKSWQGR